MSNDDPGELTVRFVDAIERIAFAQETIAAVLARAVDVNGSICVVIDGRVGTYEAEE